MNLPNDPNKKELPEEAKGNPVYEQTRQDMPLFCCGRNCGRNSRIVVLVMALIGIGCSVWFCLSPKYFTFVALRNDTFYDEDKRQPDPFRYATEADVGVFKYKIKEVYEYPWHEYPWPPPKQERYLYEDAFEEALMEEIRRLQDGNNSTPPDDAVLNDANSTDVPSVDNSTVVPLSNQTAAPTGPTAAPTWKPTSSPTPKPNITDPLIPVGPGSEALSFEPTSSPTPFPTVTNPNDIVAAEVEPLNKVKSYEFGMKQFEGDSVMTNGQRGAFFAPIFAGIGCIFCCIELFCCVYKCSWLPTAVFLYAAFMFQTFTLFMFLSEDFCKYAQDCNLGYAGFLTIISIICYMLAQSLVCCTPRPTPLFNCCKKAPVRRKKKKKKKKHDDDEENPERDGLTRDYDYEDDGFEDEPNQSGYYDDGDGYVDPYAEEDEFTNFEDQSSRNLQESSESDEPEETVDSEDIYSTNNTYQDYDNDTYSPEDDTYAQEDDTYDRGSSGYTDDDGETSYYTEDDETNYTSKYTDNDYTDSG
eukprot:CAMPEP_0117076294 /NCGR_PEP_ID=MMETSP0472-20121206/53781_1 /TAXON_ID=693140 ORGANISM="Tiarina fusus, Strain LIS" /NCGR_SAMPLE_ID=MMETSP0472 /ASSEMBLY_ACC=CAM_ASM_000603 /LENGTH=527 /DNA_ID=CAMNT_0004802133 /DNA_START=196 /DNA_END=1775 /DNA_ORIENTATION=+